MRSHHTYIKPRRSCSPSSPSPSSRSSHAASFARDGLAKASKAFRAAAFAVATSGGVALVAPPALAAPVPYVPALPAPLPPAGPVGRSLNGAYQAIATAAATDPSAAQRAQYWYVRAQQRAAAGDVAGALAAGAAAQAEALSGRAAPAAVAPAVSTIPQLPTGRNGGPSDFAPTSTLPPAHGLPVADTAALLPADLLVARNEIELAERVRPGASLDAAKRAYRQALDAYLSGNAARSRAAARASFDRAADVLSTGR